LLYVGINTTVYAYTADGQFTLKWQYDAITQVTGVLSAHGATLAVANMDGHVSAVDAATGTLKWVVSLNYATEQPPGPVAGFGNVCAAYLNHVSQAASSGSAQRLAVGGCQLNTQYQWPTRTSLIWGFHLPPPVTMTVSQCTDLKCSQGCRNATYEQRGSPRQWDTPATNYGMWDIRTCSASEMNIMVAEGPSAAASLVSLKSQYVNQCVIDEATRRSSMVTKCA
jgi:hypothetical protein